MTIYKPGLWDGCFGHQASATYGGDNSQVQPEMVRWQRGEFGAYSTFYTDMLLEKAVGAPGLKVAWLLEPPSLHDTHYKKAIEMEQVFDYILTFDKLLAARGKPWLYYPLGGSWIKPSSWGMAPKTRMISIIASEKTGAVGHKLRHEIVSRLRGKIDVWGRGYTPIGSKTHGLYDYRYSIVVESIKLDDYFSEKLIDCLSVGTVPIYWGCQAVAELFSPCGMLFFNDLDTLEQIVKRVCSKADYERRREAIADNIQRAGEFICAEDWIAKHYPFLFEKEN